jgi:hypothetical protein
MQYIPVSLPQPSKSYAHIVEHWTQPLSFLIFVLHAYQSELDCSQIAHLLELLRWVQSALIHATQYSGHQLHVQPEQQSPSSQSLYSPG